MFRALSTRRSHGRYERLADEPVIGLLEEAKLKRAASLPTRIFHSSSRKFVPQMKLSENSQEKQLKKASKSHPLFGLFDTRRKKKKTAKLQFARYMEYVKEGGSWDMNSNKPVIYYN